MQTAVAMINGKRTSIEQRADGLWYPVENNATIFTADGWNANGPHDAKLRDMIRATDNILINIQRENEPGTPQNVIMRSRWPSNADRAATMIRDSFRYVLTQRDAEWCAALGLPTYTQPKDANTTINITPPPVDPVPPALSFTIKSKPNSDHTIRVEADNDTAVTQHLMQQLVYKCRRDFKSWNTTTSNSCLEFIDDGAEYSDDMKQLMLDKLRDEYTRDFELVVETLHDETRYWFRPRSDPIENLIDKATAAYSNSQAEWKEQLIRLYPPGKYEMCEYRNGNITTWWIRERPAES